MIVGRNKIVVAYGDVWIISSETQDVIVIKRLNHVTVCCAACVFIYVNCGYCYGSSTSHYDASTICWKGVPLLNKYV